MFQGLLRVVRGLVKLKGDTDGTKIGNVGDRLKVDASLSGSATPYINRQDVSTTITANGNSSTFDTAGLSSMNFSVHITEVSGSSPTLQIGVQASDDGTNWSGEFILSPRQTATGFVRFQGFRFAGRYYRFSYYVTGTTPSFTFTITTTLKAMSQRRYSSVSRYSDLVINVTNSVSTVFLSDDCANVSVMTKRSSDAFSNTQYRVQASNNNVDWVDLTGNISQGNNTILDQTFSGFSYRFYRLITVSSANGNNPLNIFWASNG